MSHMHTEIERTEVRKKRNKGASHLLKHTGKRTAAHTLSPRDCGKNIPIWHYTDFPFEGHLNWKMEKTAWLQKWEVETEGEPETEGKTFLSYQTEKSRGVIETWFWPLAEWRSEQTLARWLRWWATLLVLKTGKYCETNTRYLRESSRGGQ